MLLFNSIVLCLLGIFSILAGDSDGVRDTPDIPQSDTTSEMILTSVKTVSNTTFGGAVSINQTKLLKSTSLPANQMTLPLSMTSDVDMESPATSDSNYEQYIDGHTRSVYYSALSFDGSWCSNIKLSSQFKYRGHNHTTSSNAILVFSSSTHIKATQATVSTPSDNKGHVHEHGTGNESGDKHFPSSKSVESFSEHQENMKTLTARTTLDLDSDVHLSVASKNIIDAKITTERSAKSGENWTSENEVTMKHEWIPGSREEFTVDAPYLEMQATEKEKPIFTVEGGVSQKGDHEVTIEYDVSDAVESNQNRETAQPKPSLLTHTKNDGLQLAFHTNSGGTHDLSPKKDILHEETDRGSRLDFTENYMKSQETDYPGVLSTDRQMQTDEDILIKDMATGFSFHSDKFSEPIETRTDRPKMTNREQTLVKEELENQITRAPILSSEATNDHISERSNIPKNTKIPAHSHESTKTSELAKIDDSATKFTPEIHSIFEMTEVQKHMIDYSEKPQQNSIDVGNDSSSIVMKVTDGMIHDTKQSIADKNTTPKPWNVPDETHATVFESGNTSIMDSGETGSPHGNAHETKKPDPHAKDATTHAFDKNSTDKEVTYPAVSIGDKTLVGETSQNREEIHGIHTTSEEIHAQTVFNVEGVTERDNQQESELNFTHATADKKSQSNDRTNNKIVTKSSKEFLVSEDGNTTQTFEASGTKDTEPLDIGDTNEIKTDEASTINDVIDDGEQNATESGRRATVNGNENHSDKNWNDVEGAGSTTPVENIDWTVTFSGGQISREENSSATGLEGVTHGRLYKTVTSDVTRDEEAANTNESNTEKNDGHEIGDRENETSEESGVNTDDIGDGTTNAWNIKGEEKTRNELTVDSKKTTNSANEPKFDGTTDAEKVDEAEESNGSEDGISVGIKDGLEENTVNDGQTSKVTPPQQTSERNNSEKTMTQSILSQNTTDGKLEENVSNEVGIEVTPKGDDSDFGQFDFTFDNVIEPVPDKAALQKRIEAIRAAAMGKGDPTGPTPTREVTLLEQLSIAPTRPVKDPVPTSFIPENLTKLEELVVQTMHPSGNISVMLALGIMSVLLMVVFRSKKPETVLLCYHNFALFMAFTFITFLREPKLIPDGLPKMTCSISSLLIHYFYLSAHTFATLLGVQVMFTHGHCVTHGWVLNKYTNIWLGFCLPLMLVLCAFFGLYGEYMTDWCCMGNMGGWLSLVIILPSLILASVSMILSESAFIWNRELSELPLCNKTTIARSGYAAFYLQMNIPLILASQVLCHYAIYLKDVALYGTVFIMNMASAFFIIYCQILVEDKVRAFGSNMWKKFISKIKPRAGTNNGNSSTSMKNE